MSENTSQRTHRMNIVLLLLVSVLTGAMFPLLEIAEQTIAPLTLTLFRTLSATAIMLFTVGVVMKRSLIPLFTYWQTFALLGLLLSLFLLSISLAEERITASASALLACIAPITAFLVTTLLLHWERFSWLRFSGTIVAMAGMVLFIGTDSLSSGHSQWIGVAIIACGYILYAINLMYAKYRAIDSFITATGTLLFAAIFTAVFAFSLEQPLAIKPSTESLLAATVVGVLSTGMAYLLLYYLTAAEGPVFAATSTYIFPIVTLLLAHAMLGEDLGLSHISGMAITLFGAWLVNHKPPKPVAV